MSRTEERLVEVLALMYEAEHESKEIYGGYHPKLVTARDQLEALLRDETDSESVPVADGVTLFE